jgi:hypothetical protein
MFASTAGKELFGHRMGARETADSSRSGNALQIWANSSLPQRQEPPINALDAQCLLTEP